jgi:pimeloyl-ACP methyl ester carboxylesterase
VTVRTLAAASIAAVGLLASVPASAVADEPATGIASPVPKLAWHRCAGPATAGFECATVRVPLSYRQPRGATIELAVIRHRASGSRPLGTLFFNPGGPGGAGTSFLPAIFALDLFPVPLRARFDVVSWDPRGVGASTAIQCFGSQRAENRFFGQVPDGFPVGRAQMDTWIRGYVRFGERCARRNGELLRHVSTADVARDMDLLRRAVGSPRLNYLGVSYGTFLGATYANLFPKRVRAMVLDGNINPQAWIHRQERANGGRFLGTELRLGTDRGTLRTLHAFLDLCGGVDTTRCAFSAGSGAATRTKFAALLRRLHADSAGAQLSYAELVGETANALDTVEQLGDDPGWSQLARLLQQAWVGTTQPGSPLSALSPRSVTAARRRYAGQEQQYAVYCAESPNPRPAAFRALDRLAFERSGAIGRFWSWLSEPCGSWPAKAADRYTGPWDRRTANPVLVIGNTHDPSTPFHEARAMARQLARARLLTVDGYGHTTLLNPSSCAQRYEIRYLVDKTLPPKGARCRQDQKPFTDTP